MKEAGLKETQQAKEVLKTLKTKYANLVTEYATALKKRDRFR